ncbi:hypothetical protein PHPALM_29028 [Phytophthora palmivora]|uniref:Tc1-like transposase DDE domain-containing protein n=1 Tax=Phytophthora palmivora TaxID=4796 RepID=A0A2P4X8N1_9STRA|nr:hypothetical protein PHPALM_29028 [Phytophthora palmivora]
MVKTEIEEAVTRQHTHRIQCFTVSTGSIVLDTRVQLAHIYRKTVRTIGNWITVYERTGTYQRADSRATRKFTVEPRKWLLEFYAQQPLAYLDEARDAFVRAHQVSISTSTVWQIIHEGGLTRKVLERRAMHIKNRNHINWFYSNIIFLDDVSFDNRGMMRKRVYSLRGQSVAIRGDFQGKPRASYYTEVTFDRVKFFQSCRDFAYSARGHVRQYPGSNSLWILDGVPIRRDPEIIQFLRSIGIVPIFLPAYCPFFNPIEFMFGYIKHYNESSGNNVLPFVVETFERHVGFDMSKVFDHCVSAILTPRGRCQKSHSEVEGVIAVKPNRMKKQKY